MKLYCISCNKFVASVGGHIRKGAVMVCAECLERYKIADQMAKQVRDQVHSDPAVENLMGMFNMKK